jgi:hypothetical protein
MSEEIARIKRLVQQASGILSAADGKVKVMQAMILVGFTTPERKNMKIYQQVRRKSEKIVCVELKKKSSVVTVTEINGSNSQASTISSITGENSQVIAIDSPDSDTQSVVSVASSRGEGKREDKKPAAKIPRGTSKEVQRAAAKHVRMTKRDKEAMKQATVLIHRSNALCRNHPDKRTTVEIVNLTNKRMNSNISANTAARYVRDGMIGLSPLKRGPVGAFPPRVYEALKGAFVTYLKLEQAASKKQSNLKDLARLVNACVNKAGHNKTRDDLTRKLKKDTADQFEVGKANVVEQRRLMWTTAYNLDMWFKTWKDTLIDLGFGRAKVDGEDVEGEKSCSSRERRIGLATLMRQMVVLMILQDKEVGDLQ